MNSNKLSIDGLYEISKKFSNNNKILFLIFLFISLRKFRLNIYNQKAKEKKRRISKCNFF